MGNRIRILCFLFRTLFFSSLYLSHPIHRYLLCNLWSCLSIPTHGSHSHTESSGAGASHPLQAPEAEGAGAAGERQRAGSCARRDVRAEREERACRGRPQRSQWECGACPSSAHGSAGSVPAQPMGARGVRRRRDGGGAVLAGRAARGEAEAVSDGAALGRGGTPSAASSPSPREPRLGSPRCPR